MKIKNIRFTNNKIFKSGEIKLVDKNNVPYETIIFIGKCGAGKTTILDSIFKASTNANDNTTTFVTDVYQQWNTNFPNRSVPVRVQTPYGQFYSQNPQYLNSENNLWVFYLSVHDKFSKLQQNTTNQKIEINIKAYRFADKEKALSNIFNQEADEFTKAYKKRKEYDNSNSFIEKFKKCIGKLLPGVDILQDDSNKLLFRKNGIDSEYKDLSSGELAIINKFAELLININFLKDSIVLVDEPEEHLHQELSENILSDIKSIITDKDGMQLSQLFVATQSDFVVQQALENTEKNLIYILERDSSNVIFKRYDEIKILSQPTTSEIRWFAFKLPTIDFHNELYNLITELINEYIDKNNDSLEKKEKYIWTPTEVDKYMIDEFKYWVYDEEKKRIFDKDGKSHENSIHTYIRNFIHHGKGKYDNKKYTKSDLKLSIEKMIDTISFLREKLEGKNK